MTTALPNLLVVFSDQHSAHPMSCAGDPNIETTKTTKDTTR